MSTSAASDQHPEPLRERGSMAYFAGVCFIAAIGGFLFGYDTAVISGALELLKKQFNMPPILQGWVVSSALVGCLLGAGAGGWLSDRFGRKRVLILSGVLFMLTSVGIATAPEPVLLSLARLVGGMGVGIASMVVPLYIAEISPAHLRGRMVSCYQFAITIGILLAYFANAALAHLSANSPDWLTGYRLYQWMVADQVWRGMLGTLFLPSAAFFVLLAFVPESPRWLTKQDRPQEAMRILARIAGRDRAQRQMSEIRETISHETGSIAQLFRPGMRKALGMAVFLACAAQLSGINAIIYYGPTIFRNAGFSMDSALGGQVILGAVNVLFTVLAMWKVDTLGRRLLLLLGNTGVFVSLVLVATSFATQATQGFFLVLWICMYLACFAFSLGPLPWVFMSEVFPTRIRGQAMSIATLMLWLTNTVVCQAFPLMDSHLGPAVTFGIFAAMVTPVFVFAAAIMPETKGRSLEELEAEFLRAAP